MSISSKVIGQILGTRKNFSEAEVEKDINYRKVRKEVPSLPPMSIKSRYEDYDDGRIFYLNEQSKSDITIFYIHGGGYMDDSTPFHWTFMKRLTEYTDAQIITPAYKRIPFGTWKEAFDLIIPLYEEYIENNPDKKIIIMGDSAGGGLAVSLIEEFKNLGISIPHETILLSPWVDVAMDTDEIEESDKLDPWLSVPWLKACGRYWANDIDTHDYRVSPIYGDLSEITNVTVFAGTREVFLPDITKFFNLLDYSDTNELIIGEEMYHAYPLLPIPEAKLAEGKIYSKILR